MKNSTQIFKFLGCNEHEIKTFQTLLGFPNGITVVQLSKISSTSRPTLYGQIDSLMQKGLVKKYSQENTSLYAAQDFEILLELYEEKINTLNNQKKDLKKLLLNGGPQKNVPRFSTYEGQRSAESILMDILRSRPVETFWIWPIEIMLDTITPDLFAYFHRERIKRNIKMKVLWPGQSKILLSEHPFLLPNETKLRKIKILPKEIKPVVGYGIYKSKVAVISNKNESFSFVVESEDFAKSLMSEFEYLWKQSKKY